MTWLLRCLNKGAITDMGSSVARIVENFLMKGSPSTADQVWLLLERTRQFGNVTDICPLLLPHVEFAHSLGRGDVFQDLLQRYGCSLDIPQEPPVSEPMEYNEPGEVPISPEQ